LLHTLHGSLWAHATGGDEASGEDRLRRWNVHFGLVDREDLNVVFDLSEVECRNRTVIAGKGIINKRRS